MVSENNQVRDILRFVDGAMHEHVKTKTSLILFSWHEGPTSSRGPPDILHKTAVLFNGAGVDTRLKHAVRGYFTLTRKNKELNTIAPRRRKPSQRAPLRKNAQPAARRCSSRRSFALFILATPLACLSSTIRLQVLVGVVLAHIGSWRVVSLHMGFEVS